MTGEISTSFEIRAPVLQRRSKVLMTAEELHQTVLFIVITKQICAYYLLKTGI